MGIQRRAQDRGDDPDLLRLSREPSTVELMGREWFDWPLAPPRFCPRLIRLGNQQQLSENMAEKRVVASDHPPRAGGIKRRHQGVQQLTRQRAPPWVVRRCKNQSRDAGTEFQRADRAVHRQLTKDVVSRQKNCQQ